MCRGRDWASREDTAPRTGLGKGAPVQGKLVLLSRVQRDPAGLPLSPNATGVALLPVAAPPRAPVAGLSGQCCSLSTCCIPSMASLQTAPCTTLSITGGGTPAEFSHTPNSVLYTSPASPLTSRIYFCCITHSVFEANKAQRGEALATPSHSRQGWSCPRTQDSLPGPWAWALSCLGCNCPQGPTAGGAWRHREATGPPPHPRGALRSQQDEDKTMWRTLLSLVEKNSYRQRGLLQPPQAGPQPPPLRRTATCPKAEGGGPHHSEQRCEPQMPAPPRVLQGAGFRGRPAGAGQRLPGRLGAGGVCVVSSTWGLRVTQGVLGTWSSLASGSMCPHPWLQSASQMGPVR